MPNRSDAIHSLDLDRLQEVLDYDPETGVFSWRIRIGPRCKLGQPAGCIKTQGYRRIAIDGVSYTASHLAWYHFYGEPSDSDLDHKDRNKDNNRISNLRKATFSQNSMNIGRLVTNTSGFKGVSKFSFNTRKKWRAQIRQNGKRFYLGAFDTPEEAYAAYCAKAAELHGKFMRLE